MKNNLRNRNGVSVIEVLFAMGIAVVGLLGIASLIPLASRNASDSIRSAEAQALAEDWYNELLTRGIHESSSWMFYQDFNITNGLQAGYAAYTNLPVQRSGSLTRVISRQAVCIDPTFLASREVATALNAGAFDNPGTGAQRWYRPSVFPYYLDTYNPTVDPAYVYSAGLEVTAKPRMVRVSPGGSTMTRNASFYRNVFSSTDDYSVFADRSDLAARPTRVASASKLLSKGDYSWIATISPTDTSTTTSVVDSAILSVAVIHRRNNVFFNPAVSAPPIRSGDPDIENKPSGERCFRVMPFSNTNVTPAVTDNFKGGHGGRVRIYGSDGVESTMHTGEWLLLGKNLANGSAIFRWFKIVAMESEAIYDTPQLGAPDQVWYRDIVLDGPDWNFDPATTTTPPDFTIAIYIPGTVAVHERIIQPL